MIKFLGNAPLPDTAITLGDVTHYDPWIVTISCCLAVFGSFMSIAILRSLSRATGKTRRLGIVLGALVMATAIWSMHYTGMLAYTATMEHSYDPWATILSGLVAFLFALGVFYILTRRSFDHKHVLLSAPLLGIGVAAMHYFGMSAMEMRAEIYYKSDLFALSIAIAMTASAAALWIMHRVSRLDHHHTLFQSIAALIMGIAVCGMHYTGMAATVIVPYADCRFLPDQEFTILALSIGLVACFVIGIISTFPLYVRQSYSQRSAENEFRFLSNLQYMSIALNIIAIASTGFICTNLYIMREEIMVTVGHEHFDKAHTYITMLLYALLPAATAIIIGIGSLMQGRKILKYAMVERNFAQNVMDAIPDPIFVKDSKHVWRAGNKQFWKMMGGAPDQYIGKGDHDIFPPEQVAIFWEKDDLVIRTGVTDINEEFVNNAKGETMVALTTKTPLTLADGEPGLVGIIHDITKLKNIEQELARHRDNLQRMVEVQTYKIEEEKLIVTILQNAANIANEARTLIEALKPTLALLSRYLQCQIGHAYLYDPRNNELVTSNVWYLADKNKYAPLMEKSKALRFTPGHGIPGQVLKTGKPIWATNINDEKIYPRTQQIKETGMSTCMAFPIVCKGQVVAVLEFFTHDHIELNEDIQTLFHNIGTILSVVVEREYTEKALRNALTDAEKANQLKSEFLANMSHELRTPMHSIITFSRQGIERMERWDKAAQAENLALIKESGERLLSLLNDLLDLSKLEAGAVDYQFRDLNIIHLIHQASRQLQSLLDEKELSVCYNLDESLPVICGDDGKITQVLLNLISNAIKFTPIGKAITIDCRHDETTAEHIHLTIRDDGIGIPPDELELVFDKFVQSSKTKSGAGGTGLGLAICKEIILGHRGSIYAENNANGQGACFHIRIPIHQPAARQAA